MSVNGGCPPGTKPGARGLGCVDADASHMSHEYGYRKGGRTIPVRGRQMQRGGRARRGVRKYPHGGIHSPSGMTNPNPGSGNIWGSSGGGMDTDPGQYGWQQPGQSNNPLSHAHTHIHPNQFGSHGPRHRRGGRTRAVPTRRRGGRAVVQRNRGRRR